jgi:methyl-accepting chemotaxis protein
MQVSAIPLAQETGPSVHYRVIGKRGVYYAVAPIEATQVMPSERMQHLTAELMLMGTASGATANATPQTVRRGHVQILLSPESMQADIRKTFVTGIGLTCGIILVGVLIAFVFYSYTLTPVQARARAASRIAAGDLSQRVKATSRDEIGVLVMTFNHMAASLDATYRDLEQLNVGLEEKSRHGPKNCGISRSNSRPRAIRKSCAAWRSQRCAASRPGFSEGLEDKRVAVVYHLS